MIELLKCIAQLLKNNFALIAYWLPQGEGAAARVRDVMTTQRLLFY